MKIIIASGYFNPLHLGHIQLISSAKKMGDYLVMIINNDRQQILKKGKIIMNENERSIIISSLKYVDEVFIAHDIDKTVNETLEFIAKKYNKDNLFFVNGGDDRTSIEEIPESDICKKYNIEIVFGVGGYDKVNSSSRINRLLGKEK